MQNTRNYIHTFLDNQFSLNKCNFLSIDFYSGGRFIYVLDGVPLGGRR